MKNCPTPQGLFNKPKFIFMASHITADAHIKGLIWFIVTNEVKPRRTRNSAEYFDDYPIIYRHHHALIDSFKWLRHRLLLRAIFRFLFIHNTIALQKLIRCRHYKYSSASQTGLSCSRPDRESAISFNDFTHLLNHSIEL